MVVLDTMVLSELMRDPPAPAVLRWLQAQDPTSVCTTALNVFEVALGLGAIPPGARATRLRNELDGLVRVDLGNRIFPLDEAGARCAASLGTARRLRGRPVPPLDTLIAGIALSRGAAVATRNTRHFDDLGTGVVDPWTAARI